MITIDQFIDLERIKILAKECGYIKLIFLDCDGVMNNYKFYEIPSIVEMLKKGDRGDYMFDPNSCRLLNLLAKECNAVICITSDIRNDNVNEKRFLDGMRDVALMNLLTGEVVAITPFIYDSNGQPARGKEIEWVLKFLNKNAIRVETYVILDDFKDYIEVHQQSHFVKCEVEKGFQEEEYELARKILLASDSKT